MLSEKTKYASKWLLTGCATMALLSTGCRSMPGMGMFGMRGSEPSAETLAGSGPSTTYPPPPSASVTPEAIASIAGGTAVPVTPGVPAGNTAQVAGVGITPGFATPATNMSAAQANGFAANTKPAGYAPGATKPSGYSFGSKTFTPKTSTSLPPQAPGSSYTRSSTYTPPSTGYTIPNKVSPSSSSVADSKPAGDSSNGFTLPSDLSPAVAAATGAAVAAPTMTPPAPTATASESVPPGGFAPPAADSPSFSTASATGAITAPSTSITPPAPPAPAASSGYSPGSTAGAAGYPTGDSVPTTTNGSYFR